MKLAWLKRVPPALALIAVFLGQVIVSGLTTTWLIVKPGRRPTPGLMRIPYAGIDPTGAALLGGLITLTPGTTTLDIDLERRELLVHLLDASNPELAAREIHLRFERPMRRIFPMPPMRPMPPMPPAPPAPASTPGPEAPR